MDARTKRRQLESFARHCRAWGIPLTAQRRAMLASLVDLDGHPTADAVDDAVVSTLPTVSRTTVYRTLETFVRMGVITKVCHPGSAVRYDMRTEMHHHLVCLRWKLEAGSWKLMMPHLTFLGAARTVTGSKYLVESNGTRVLVDCGLFQGLKELRERNWQPLPVDPSTIDAVVLTHAHLDHCGYLPRLVAEGFVGRIFCTQATGHLCRIILPDAGRLQEEDAESANPRGLLPPRAGAAALYRRRREPSAAAVAARRLRPADAGSRRARGDVRQLRAPARVGLRAGGDRQRHDAAHDPLRRRPRALRQTGAARSDTGRSGRHPARGVHLRRSAA